MYALNKTKNIRLFANIFFYIIGKWGCQGGRFYARLKQRQQISYLESS